MASDRIQPEPEPRRRNDREREEIQEDRPRRRRRREDDEEEEDYRRIRRRNDPIETLIPYHNPMGLVAYYLGVFSLIPVLGLLLGPGGLTLGILGLKYRKKNPSAGGTGHAIAGIVLGSITSLFNWGVVILVLIAILKK